MPKLPPGKLVPVAYGLGTLRMSKTASPATFGSYNERPGMAVHELLLVL
jgi:hypothetical protein